MSSDLVILPTILLCTYLLVYHMYNYYFHPLARIPGPFFARISPWPSAIYAWRGNRHLWLEQCFQTYGNKIRVAPDTIIFRDPTAYRDIYGTRANVRRSDFYNALKVSDSRTNTITLTDNTAHSRSRKLLDQAFTTKSLRSSADFMQHHIDRWHELLALESAQGWTPPFNFTDKVNHLIFDILGDICYGASFSTKEPGSNPLKALPRTVVDTATAFYTVAKSPFLHLVNYARPRGLSHVLKALRPPAVIAFDNFITTSVARGIAREEDRTHTSSSSPRHDMFHFLYAARDTDTGLPAFRGDTLAAECGMLLVAGSDFTSVTLCGAFFYLSHYPRVLARLLSELEHTFPSAEAIVPGPELSSCIYLRATVDEAMRMVPAGPSELPRQVLPGGTVIAGERFPADTIVGTAAWCDGFNDDVYGDAAVFRPERWIVDEDNVAEEVARIRANFHPFSIGPFNCAGMKFAMQEVMLVVAKTVWRFEMRLAAGWEGGEGRRHRRRVGEREMPVFQVGDAYVTVKEGPVVQFRKRRG